MFPEEIPNSLQEALSGILPGESARLVVETDLGADGNFGGAWLVLTDSRLLVLADASAGHQLRFNRPRAEIRRVKLLNQVGKAALQAELTDGSWHQLVGATDARTRELGHAGDDLNHALAGEPVPAAEVSRSQPRCPRCTHRIPQDLTKCPRCTDRRKTLRGIFRFADRHRRLLVGIFACMIASTLAGLIPPYLSKVFIDDLYPTAATATMSDFAGMLGLACALLLASYFLQFLFDGAQGWLAGRCGHHITHDVRSAVYEQLQELSLSYFDRHQTGALMARINQDTNELRRLLVDFIPLAAQSAFMLIGVGAVLCHLSWSLTIFTLIPIALTLLYLQKVFFRVRIYWHRFMHRRSRLSAFVNDSLSGARVIKAFGKEAHEAAKFDQKSAAYRDAGIQLEQKWSIYHPSLHFLIQLGPVMVWFIGGLFLFGGEMTIGAIIAFTSYLSMFYRPVFALTRMLQEATNALTAAERIFDIIATTPEIVDAPDARAMPSLAGEIEFQEVSFGYHPFAPVIKELSVSIHRNEMIGLVGRSGAGKSTFINLLCRLYDVNRGRILIDGVDVRQIRHDDLRRQFGIVLQETFLFNGSIYDNLLYARAEATAEEVVEAARAANAHEFILAKPDGYDTEVGERGSHLSGGEKQRLAIARAILRNPRILILDEATSSIDAETEQKIQEAITRLTRDRTTIAIAHRLSTLRHCDRLFVIQEGRIIESGTHAELLARKGVFHQLVETQRQSSEIIAVEG